MSRTRYGISPWIDQFPSARRPTLPRFRGELHAPVVIIGAGLSGCCTAYALAAAGIPAVVLEAERIGLGGAGRSSGVASGEPMASFRDLEAQRGRRAARAMFDASRRAVLDLGATLRRLAVHADFTALDALRLAVPETASKDLQREASARRDAGLDTSWVKGEALRRLSLVEASGGMRLRGWAHVDPCRVTLGFARAAMARGATFFERSAVTRIKTGRRAVTIHSGDGTLTADTVIVCTGEPTKLFGSLRRHFKFADQYAVLTAPMPAAVRRELGGDLIVTDAETPPHQVWRTADHRLVVAGATLRRMPERGREKVLVQRTGQLMYELSRLFPAISGLAPEFGWHSPQSQTADGAMYAGPHRNFPHHLFVWGTCHDPARAFLASRVLLRHIQGAPEKEDAYFAFTR